MEPIAALFPLLLRMYPDTPELKEGMILIAWKFCVGEKIREVSTPVRFQGGILEVLVPSAAWQSTLDSMKKEIRGRINEYVQEPMLKQIRIRVKQ